MPLKKSLVPAVAIATEIATDEIEIVAIVDD